MSTERWSTRLSDALVDSGATMVTGVPDGSIGQVIQAIGDRLARVEVTREEEAIGIAFGVALSGRLPLVAMQNSGLGNCINALGSLVAPARLPVLMLINMRGDIGEFNPAQVPIGQATERLLAALDIPYCDLRRPEELDVLVDRAARMATSTELCVALLLRDDLTGGKRG